MRVEDAETEGVENRTERNQLEPEENRDESDAGYNVLDSRATLKKGAAFRFKIHEERRRDEDGKVLK